MDFLKNKTLKRYFQSYCVEDTQQCAKAVALVCQDLFDQGRHVQMPYKTSSLDVMFVGLSAESFSGKSTMVRAFMEALRQDDSVRVKREERCGTRTRNVLTWDIVSNMSDFFEMRAYDAAWVANAPERADTLPVRHLDGIDLIEHPHCSGRFDHAPKSSKVELSLESFDEGDRQIIFCLPSASPQEQEIVDYHFDRLRPP